MVVLMAELLLILIHVVDAIASQAHIIRRHLIVNIVMQDVLMEDLRIQDVQDVTVLTTGKELSVKLVV
jgi:hypothetical protein